MRRLLEIDAEAEFVDQTGAVQQLATSRIQLPLVGDLLREVGGELADAFGLLGVDQVTALQVADGADADILLHRQMQHAVNQAFTQCPAGQHHALDAQLLEDGQQNGQAAREHQRALQRQPFDLQLFQLAALNGALFQLAQLGQGDAFIHALCHHDLLQRLHGAGSADADLPTLLAQLRCDRPHHFARGLFGALEIFLPEVAIAEVAFQPGDAAHRQAIQLRCLRAGAGDQFGAAAADVDDQPPIRPAGGVRNAVINQPRFFFAADHLHRAAEDLLGDLQELIGVGRQAQRGGGDDADLLARNVLQAFREQPQALPAALHGLMRQVIVLIQPGRQTHLALDAGQSLNAAGHLAHHQHVEAVGAEIDGSIKRAGTEHGDQLERLRLLRGAPPRRGAELRRGPLPPRGRDRRFGAGKSVSSASLLYLLTGMLWSI